MSDAHSRGVTKKRLALENSLDAGVWDDVFTEEEYYAEQDLPYEEPSGDKGRMKGEFDVLAVNYDRELALYVEVKSTRGDLYKAGQQLERAEDHFAPEWDVIGQSFLEQS